MFGIKGINVVIEITVRERRRIKIRVWKMEIKIAQDQHRLIEKMRDTGIEERNIESFVD